MIYKIIPVENAQNIVVLPFYLESPFLKEIHYGQKMQSCRILSHYDHNNTVYVSQNLCEELLLPPNMETKITIWHNRLVFGPLVGILTAGFTKSSLRPAGKRSILFAKYIESGKGTGANVLLFGAHQINWEDETIEGYTFTQDGWKKIKAPFPNVLYNRLPNRKVENLESFTFLKSKLTNDYHIPMFNHHFFNKWDTFKLLSKSKADSYLPETYASPSIEEIEGMLQKHTIIFLKPINGSLGLGVYKLMYSPEKNCYYCRYVDKKNEKRLTKYSSLHAFLKSTFRNRDLKHYIVQQGIKLLQFNQNPIDFRIHVNKNEHGQWILSAMAAKIAGKGSVTTHIKNGGMIKTVHEIQSLINPSFSLANLLTEAAFTICSSLDHQLDGTIGEIGFDFGIDRFGKVWLFEANSKPGRSIFQHEALQKEDIRTREIVFQYAEYLMQKSIHLRAGVQ
ncbi:YheC/YheD family protein [Bacillus sp. FJAT-47783]|uniref:YheC/YheD family endospore coat-associated protein n=1 Tax=Bacillus sp. FJAT-47783 TaxID=2922712 RepID=UPI001FACC4C6|nr:YheC/YheD family protein [Bacillus sp. FJAT-47783]